MSNFLAPAIAVVLLPFFSTIGVVIAYTGLYVVAFFLCAFIRVEQPGFSTRKQPPASRLNSHSTAAGMRFMPALMR